jgi:hypothetical protein
VNIYDYLKRDHARQRYLANAIIDTRPGSNRRQKMFTQFKLAWRRHADIEARTLYSALLRWPRADIVTRKGIEGKRRVAEAFNELERHPMDSEAWMSGFVELRERLEDQQCEDEELLYTTAERLFTDPETIQQMTNLYERHGVEENRADTPVTRLRTGKPRSRPLLDPDWQSPVVIG